MMNMAEKKENMKDQNVQIFFKGKLVGTDSTKNIRDFFQNQEKKMEQNENNKKILQYLHKVGFQDPVDQWQFEFNEMVNELTFSGKFAFKQ